MLGTGRAAVGPSMLPDRQRAVARAILLDDEEMLGPWADPRLRARFEIHRNNVLSSLAGVLATAFPLCAGAMGEGRFQTAARAFLAVSPPRRAELFAYGDAFPAFLDAAPAAADMPWLADLARLEWARNEALFAADADSFDPAALAAAGPRTIAALRLALVPSARILRALHPVGTIYGALAAGRPVRRLEDTTGEDMLVWRHGDQVTQRLLSDGEADLLAALADGRTLGEAAAAAPAGFDLTGTLGQGFTDRIFARSEHPVRKEPRR